MKQLIPFLTRGHIAHTFLAGCVCFLDITSVRVRKKDTRRIYAMKVLDKQRILRDGKQTLQHVLAERQILIKTRSSPFLVGLKFSFQTVDALHLVMDLKSGGELMSYMQRYGGRFPEPWVCVPFIHILLLTFFYCSSLSGHS